MRPRLNFFLGHFGAWVDFRVRSDVPVLLDRGIDDMINVWHLFEYVEHALATTRLRSATIESHLSAIKFVHRTSRDFELDTTHPVIASAFDGATRLHVEVGNQATVRRPLSWGMLLAAEKLSPILCNGGRGLWLAFGSSFCLLNASRRFFRNPVRESTERIVYGRKTWLYFAVGYSWWWRNDRQPTTSRFDFVGPRATSCAQGRLILPVRASSTRPVGSGGGAVSLMLEFMSCILFLPSSAPLTAYGSRGGR